MTGRAPTSSSFHYQWTYDVFINFRGEDTRHGFVGNLYHALSQKGVHTFIDDEELKRGDEITPTLLNAIENSRMAVTVFSKDYASSTFCLNELVKIHQCIKGKDRLVWPIFYDVKPSIVRHQLGKYGEALAMHKQDSKADEEKIQSWKLALCEVANISGLHFDFRQGYEYQFIERIVKEISSKINRVPLYVAEYPIGLDSRVLKIKTLLQIGLNDEISMVGISGIGGVGKTTLARAVYNSIADNFEGLCFLHDIKENSRKFGLERMQERMLSKILGVDIKVEDVNEGVEIIKMRLKRKRVLLILDNIDKNEQLKKLVGECNWFGVGSRIIITTRDKHLLLTHGVEREYDMEAFNDEESLELLSWNAFRNNIVNPTHKMVLTRAINYAKGLPLALEVIGSNLCGMSVDEWESALDGYERVPNEDIQQILKISYDGLKQVEKEIFLDIACFFKGKELEYIKAMEEHFHDFDPSYGIRVLVDKCLISIDEYCIEMHDLIQDMGIEIVRQESPKEPGKRSRLWINQDIVHVLEANTGTNEVSSIIQEDFSECIEVNWDGGGFKNMNNLKILIFKNVKFSESPKYLPNSLKVLQWQGYPYSDLPLHFCPKKLAVFDIAHSCLCSLETIEKLENLSVLNLGGCQYITQIPDLSSAKDLRKLDLQSCKNLSKIHDSVGYLPKLKYLNIRNCTRLEIFPRKIKLPSLEVLLLERCSSLKYFPEILDKMKIRYLHLVGTGIEKLHWSICNLALLNVLFIQQNRVVIELPKSIFHLPKLQEIKAESCRLVHSNLEEAQEQAISWSIPYRYKRRYKRSIYLRECDISDELLQISRTCFFKVNHLDLTGNNFTILPAWMNKCHCLQSLVLNKCKHLREVEGIPPSIKHLGAIDCISLSSKSKSLLLSEELLRASVLRSSSLRTFFCVPTRSIPDWFNYKSKGASISFWIHIGFPSLCLCVLSKSIEGVHKSADEFYPMSISVYLNDNEVYSRQLWGYDIPKVDHLVVYDLDSNDIPWYKMEQAFQNGKWNHVKVYAHLCGSDDAGAIEESGIYVVEQYRGIGETQFSDPYEGVDSISGEEKGTKQFGTIIKEQEPILNKKRTLMEDGNFASCSNAFGSTKRGRNCSINQYDNATNTTAEIQNVNAIETIENQGTHSSRSLASYAKEHEKEYNYNSSKCVSSPFGDIDAWSGTPLLGYTYDTSGNQEATFIDLDVNNTSLPMLPLTEHASDTFCYQDCFSFLKRTDYEITEKPDDDDDMNLDHTSIDEHNSIETIEACDGEGNLYLRSGDAEEKGTEQFDTSMNRKRTLMDDDNFASRRRNCPINEDDNDTNTTEIQYANATETLGNQVPLASYAKEHEKEYNYNSSQWVSSCFGDIDAWSSAPLLGYTYDTSGNQVNDINNGYKWLTSYPCSEAGSIDLDVNSTSLPMLPLTEHASDTFSYQGHGAEYNKWVSMLRWETPIYDGSSSHQEFQLQQNVTSINVEQIPESFDVNRKARGKEKVVYNDNIKEKWVEHAGNTYNNQGYSAEDNKWVSMLPWWETPLYDWCNSHQEFEQQQNMTSINVEQILESSSDNRKARGKKIVAYNDNINEK